MPLVRRVFYKRMTRLSVSIVLVQRKHSPGSQLWHDLPALAQGQLREVQELDIEQKQQRSSRAAAVF